MAIDDGELESGLVGVISTREPASVVPMQDPALRL